MQQRSLLAPRRPACAGVRPHRRVVCASTSVDPLTLSGGPYQPGKVHTIHGPAELQTFTSQEPHKAKLTVLMAKSSSCRPCKRYMATYHSLAEIFKDAQLLEIVGDESKETRKMMMEMKIKATPSFFVYRNGQQLYTQSGIANNALPKALKGFLLPSEAGHNWQPPQVTSSDDEA